MRIFKKTEVSEMFPKNIFSLLILSVVIYCFSGCSDSPSPIIQPSPTSTPVVLTAGSIQGVVSNQLAVIPNAYLKYYHFQSSVNDNNLYTTFANERGEYLIENLPPGEGLIEAWLSKEGHDNQTENPIANYKITITIGITTIQDIKSGHFDAYGKNI